MDLGFNIFALVSDLYYRENFHSDVLRAMLDPKSKHGDGDAFLRLFLQFLKRHGARIDVDEFRDTSVFREQGRIDILIKDEISKKAIVVENKMNGAGDMQRQLPRYVEYASDQGYTVDAIAYLRLGRRQHPDKSGWTPAERREIEAKLISLCAYDETDDDLLNGWLLPCERIAQDCDAQYIFRQYRQLITKLGKNTMNKPIMEQFYALMLEGDNYRSAMSVNGMLEDLILFRVEKIIDTFKSDLNPFDNVANWKDHNAYFTGCHWNGAHLGIDVGVEPDGYRFVFWDRDDDEGTKGRARSMLSLMNVLSEYKAEGGEFVKRFAFPSQEKELFDHIREFKARLAETLAAEATTNT